MPTLDLSDLASLFPFFFSRSSRIRCITLASIRLVAACSEHKGIYCAFRSFNYFDHFFPQRRWVGRCGAQKDSILWHFTMFFLDEIFSFSPSPFPPFHLHLLFSVSPPSRIPPPPPIVFCKIYIYSIPLFVQIINVSPNREYERKKDMERERYVRAQFVGTSQRKRNREREREREGAREKRETERAWSNRSCNEQK